MFNAGVVRSDSSAWSAPPVFAPDISCVCLDCAVAKDDYQARGFMVWVYQTAISV